MNLHHGVPSASDVRGCRRNEDTASEADVIVIGSPVYFSYPTGETRSFLERLIFPNFTYDYDEQGKRLVSQYQKA